MSLRWRIVGAFIFVIILTILLSIGVAYWTAQRNLNALIDQVGQDEVTFLSEYLSREYTRANGWQTLDFALAEVGYFSGIESIEVAPGFFPPLDVVEFVDVDEFYKYSPAQILVTDLNGVVLMDSALKTKPGDVATFLPNIGADIINLNTLAPVGRVYVTVDDIFWGDESGKFLMETIVSTAQGGLLTAIVVSLLGIWFAGRITAPVTALTQATKDLASQKEAKLLPVTSTDELGQMTASFNELSTALNVQRELRRRLIDDVSHELNTPLSVIRLEAKGLEDGIQPPQEAAEQIIQEVEMLRNLVHDLSWLAETDSGELQLNFETYDIEMLLKAEVERWQTPAQTQQVALRLGSMPELPTLRLDPVRMSQLLGNLLRNALQHTEAGGEICIEATLTSSYGAPSEGIDHPKAQRFVAISIRDTGFGIDPDHLPFLFERFYRTDQSRNRVSGGRGLGLAISRAIAEGHGGTISISSGGLGQGATVRVELPV